MEHARTQTHDLTMFIHAQRAAPDIIRTVAAVWHPNRLYQEMDFTYLEVVPSPLEAIPSGAIEARATYWGIAEALKKAPKEANITSFTTNDSCAAIMNAFATPGAMILASEMNAHPSILQKVLAFAEDVVRAGGILVIRSTTFGPNEIVTDEVAETVRRGVAEARRMALSALWDVPRA